MAWYWILLIVVLVLLVIGGILFGGLFVLRALNKWGEM